jgi:hypothetical protein
MSGRRDGHIASADSHDSRLHKVLAFDHFGPSCICRLMRCRVRRRNMYRSFLRGSPHVRQSSLSDVILANLLGGGITKLSCQQQRLYPIHSSDMPISNSAIVSSVGREARSERQLRVAKPSPALTTQCNACSATTWKAPSRLRQAYRHPRRSKTVAYTIEYTPFRLSAADFANQLMHEIQMQRVRPSRCAYASWNDSQATDAAVWPRIPLRLS